MLKVDIIKSIDECKKKVGDEIPAPIQQLTYFVESLPDSIDISYQMFKNHLKMCNRNDVIKQMENEYFQFANPYAYSVLLKLGIQKSSRSKARRLIDFSKFEIETETKTSENVANLEIKLKTSENNANKFVSAPRDIKFNILRYLNFRDVISLSQTSTALFFATKDQGYWVEQIIRMGFNFNLIVAVRNLDVIKDYQRLYRTLRTVIDDNKNVEISSILYLSGEIKAITHASIFYPKSIKESLNLIARSGNVEGMQYAVNILKVNPQSVDADGRNALHNAAIGRSVKAMEYAINTLKIDPTIKDKFVRNIFTITLGYPNAETIKYAIKILNIDVKDDKIVHRIFTNLINNENIPILKCVLEDLKIDLAFFNKTKNILPIAAVTGNREAIKFVIEYLKIVPNSKDASNQILSLVLWNGDIAAIKYVIEELKLDPTSTTNDGLNALHDAAIAGNAVAVRYLIEDLKLDPTSTTKNGKTASNYINQSIHKELHQYLIDAEAQVKAGHSKLSPR